MDYNDKPRLAKEALDSGSYDKDTIEHIFPELVESEDDRIRKGLICFLETEIPQCNARDKYIAWLEKQGEKDKFIEKELQCIKGYRENAIKKLEELEKQRNEQKPADKVEPKFKIGDVVRLKHGDGLEWIIEEKHEDGNYTIVCADRNDCVLLDDKWELVEQKPAWSEKDNAFCNGIISHFEKELGDGTLETECSDKQVVSDLRYCYKQTIFWLKSLKDRYIWKPSDEQMMYLSEGIDVVTKAEKFSIATALKELREQLKKLKG